MSRFASLDDVLLVTYVYPPDNYAGAARPFRFAKFLERRGFRVNVVAAAVPELCGVFGNVHRLCGEMDHAPRRSVSFYAEKALRLLFFCHDEGITWVPRVIRYVGRLRSRHNYHCVLVSSGPPLTTHIAALMLKFRFGWPWIADFRDPLLGNPYRLPRSRAVDAFLERLLLRHVDVAIANTDTVADMWRSRYPNWRQKFEVLWNGFDPENPVRARPLPPRPNRVIAHVGSLYGDRYPVLLIASLDRLIAAGKLDPSSIRVQLAGPSSEPRSADASCPWLSFIPGQIPQADARQIAAEADYLLLLDVTTQLPGQPAGLQVPGKLFDYVNIGRPILACTTRNSPVDRILQRAGIPHTCLYPDSLAEENDQRVLQFLALPSDPVPASEWFEQNFSAASQAQQLESIIRRVQEPC